MIDSSTLLLTIVMTTPAEFHDNHNNQNFVSFNSLGELMQRLCWPHTHTMNLECETKGTMATHHQSHSDESIAKPLDTYKLMRKYEREQASHQ